jgi:hypothetical protein
MAPIPACRRGAPARTDASHVLIILYVVALVVAGLSSFGLTTPAAANGRQNDLAIKRMPVHTCARADFRDLSIPDLPEDSEPPQSGAHRRRHPRRRTHRTAARSRATSAQSFARGEGSSRGFSGCGTAVSSAQPQRLRPSTPASLDRLMSGIGLRPIEDFSIYSPAVRRIC